MVLQTQKIFLLLFSNIKCMFRLIQKHKLIKMHRYVTLQTKMHRWDPLESLGRLSTQIALAPCKSFIYNLKNRRTIAQPKSNFGRISRKTRKGIFGRNREIDGIISGGNCDKFPERIFTTLPVTGGICVGLLDDFLAEYR